ncbi:MAG: adenosylmethionine decarboxylase [Candidatus Omnitrophica bacterium]|nr:adenosylmethionine decarboxylase [Candidatus Omnitrophota bacterium]
MKRPRKKIKSPDKEPYSVHLIADFEAPVFIEDARRIKKILWRAALLAHNTPLRVSIYKFPVQGVTGVVLLAESHIAIHSWPEHGYLAIDIFTCGKQSKPYEALAYLKEVFRPKKVKVMLIKRGRS